MSSAVKSIRGSKSDAVSFRSERNSGSKLTNHDPSDILWPEWSDAEINSEKWGAAIKYDPSGKEKVASPVTKKNTSRIDNSSGKAIENEQFEDPYPVELAWSLHKGNPIFWQRPSAVFPDIKLVIHAENASICPDLTTSNRRILRSEFIRSFISSVQILTYLGYQHPFQIEWQTVQFTANTSNLPWEPWHHIYSIGRAGGSAQHSPVCNILGKYVVRLFWLGCWRKIFVDDRFPVNSAGRPLLPTTTIENNTELELWPLLLTKALMKIASLSWTDHKELVDFDIISCLTGWAVQKLNIKGLEMTEKWEICCSYSDHFTWDKKLLNDDSSAQAPEIDATPKEKNKEAKENKNKKKVKANADVLPTDTVDFHLVGTLADLRNYADILEDITPCWSHDCLLESTRSVPLVKQVSDITDEFASWKEFRWIDWAIEQGLREAGFTLENKRFIKVVSSLRKIIDHNTVDLETSYKEKCIKNCVDAYHKFLEQKDAGKLGKKPASASSPTKEKPSKTPKVPKFEKFVDPSVWCYFNNIGEYINTLSIYIKPSSFSSRYVLTNFKISGSPIAKKSPKKDDKKNKEVVDTDAFKHILWENILQKTRNDTMYLFTDSIDFRLTIFTLAHVGKDIPECQKEVNFSNDIFPVECNKTICTSGNCLDDCSCQKKDSIESVSTNFVDQRRTASIIVEDFDWTSRQTGDMSMFLKTYGTSSLFFNFARGRHVKRIWMNAEPVFCLHVFSDDPNIKIGKCDEILEFMAMESELLTQKSFQLCSAFGDLVRYFATPDYPQALKVFYKSYLPDDVQLSKKNAARIHNCFLNEMKLILEDSYPEMFYYDMSRAIRVLFLDPNFRIPYTADFDPYVPSDPIVQFNNSCPCVDTKEFTEKEQELAAIKIQSFFKMYYVKRMKDIHNINNNHLPRIIECIKSIYMDIFSSKNRDVCMRVMRGMIFNHDIKDLLENYIFYKDLKTVIDLKIFSGDVSEIKQMKFMPLFKRTFYCNDDDVFMRPYIYSTLSTYIVRVFNNDTGDEIDRYTNNALVHKYVKNKKGYTIFAYGVSGLGVHGKNHSWKLLIVSEKIYLSSSIEVDQQANSTLQLDGVYLPNLDNLICKILVKINHNCKGTFHFQASSSTARLKMQCTTLKGDILAEAYGMSTVIIPFVNLILEKEDESAQEIVSIERSLKQAKKFKNQRRVSSKSLAIKERRKLEKESTASILPSISTKKKTFSTVEYRSSLDFKDFVIRVFLLENSWPLTINEWTLVHAVRNQANVEPELVPNKTPHSHRGSILQKKLNARQTPRRGSKLKEMPVTKPFWIFTSYCDGPQKQMSITVDYSRMEEIREIKRKIILDNTGRYLEGKEKRQEFLERSYIQWTPPKSASLESFSDYSLLEHIDSTLNVDAKKKNRSLESGSPPPELIIQQQKPVCSACQHEFDPNKYEYLKAPESRHKMLPPFDYNKYYEKINEYRWPIDQKRENEILGDIEKEIEKFNEKNLQSMESIDRFLQETKQNYTILSSWYKDIREESNQMMVKNDAKREYYKEKIKEVKPGKASATKTERSKKK